MKAQEVFARDRLMMLYDAFDAQVMKQGDVVRTVTKTQVSYAAKRQFMWLSPLSKTKALATVDTYESIDDPVVASQIDFRPDKNKPSPCRIGITN